ncbi:MAG: SRPBCC family protein [Rubrobacteraceae bacterium]
MTEKGSVEIKEQIEAPATSVAAYIGDFRHAKDWMVGVESVEQLGEDFYRLEIETPIGHVKPEVRMLEHNSERIRWIYTSTIEGGGLVEVSPNGNGSCVVSYAGDFKLKQRLLGRVAKALGSGFARRNGERSLERLKYLMEAHRY